VLVVLLPKEHLVAQPGAMTRHPALPLNPLVMGHAPHLAGQGLQSPGERCCVYPTVKRQSICS
jgi:hypothetical protein